MFCHVIESSGSSSRRRKARLFVHSDCRGISNNPTRAASFHPCLLTYGTLVYSHVLYVNISTGIPKNFLVKASSIGSKKPSDTLSRKGRGFSGDRGTGKYDPTLTERIEILKNEQRCRGVPGSAAITFRVGFVVDQP